MKAWGRIALTSALAGALVGAADALLVLGTNPDMGLSAWRLAFVFGPVLISAAWAVPLGLGVALLRHSARAAAGAVVAAWTIALVVDAARAGQSLPAVGLLAALLGLAATAVALLALETAGAVSRLGRTGRLAAVGGVVLFGVVAVTALGAAWNAALSGGGGPCRDGPRDPRARPNVVLITIDSLRADAARSMRSYRRLAARGTEYLQHTTSSPWTLPSVASLLTGLQPAQHGAGRSRSWHQLVARTPLADRVPTLAGQLGSHGYRTHAVVTNPFLTSRYGIDRGFCSFENVSMEGETVRAFRHTTPLRLADALAPSLLPSDRAHTVVHRAEHWLGAHGDEPFFLWVHFLDPHAPYGDRDGAPTSLTLDLMAFQHRDPVMAPFRPIALLRAGEYRPGGAERARIVALYREDVDYVDGALDRLLDLLDARGLSRRTAVVLTADHGEEFWEHGGVEHGRSLFEEVMRVPLIVVPPGGRDEPSVESELSSVIDVTPTILGLAGIDPGGLPGADLTATRAIPERALPLGSLLFGEEWVGVRTSRTKFLRAEHGEERFYDLTRDPQEQLNRVASDPAALTPVRAGLLGPPGTPGSGGIGPAMAGVPFGSAPLDRQR